MLYSPMHDIRSYGLEVRSVGLSYSSNICEAYKVDKKLHFKGQCVNGLDISSASDGHILQRTFIFLACEKFEIIKLLCR